MLKSLFAASIVAAAMATSASAATLNGVFEVTAVNAVELDREASKATMDNYNSALTGQNPSDSFTYEGNLDFGTFDGTDGTTIEDWLLTGGGTVTGLDAVFGDLQLSKPSIGDGTATTTFFMFTSILNAVGDFLIKHDDGVAVFDDGTRIGGLEGPNTVKTTTVLGFDGGAFSLLYVATNGDPSVLNVNGNLTPVPLPATLPLLLVGMGGIAMMRRKRA